MPNSFDNIKDLMFVITLAPIPTSLVSQSGSSGSGSASSPISIGGDVTGAQAQTFGTSNANQITIRGFRAVVDIDHGGGAMLGTLRASIYGVAQSDMNDITTLQYQPRSLIPNTISVYAIDGAQQTLVFQGNLVTAWGNYQTMPEVFLQLTAQAAYFNKLLPIPATSFQGAGDVATIASQLAATMGYAFDNTAGVSAQLSNPYLPGTGIDQMNALATAAGIWWGIDNGTLFITPSYTARGGTQIPEVGPQSGLISYPSFDGAGIVFRTIFNPAIRFMGLLNLVTSIPRAAGQWIATGISHNLETVKPGGRWESTIRANFAGIAST